MESGQQQHRRSIAASSEELYSVPVENERMERHFTATALVIDEERHRALLLWHKRLQRWMPPGGHMDPNEIPEETAQREANEETGLNVEILGEAQEDFYHNTGYEGRILKKPFAFFLETIPASDERGEPAHEHIDFIFRARASDPEQALTLCAAESDHLRWFTREDIERFDTSCDIYANVKNLFLHLLSSTSPAVPPVPLALAGAHRRDH